MIVQQTKRSSCNEAPERLHTFSHSAAIPYKRIYSVDTFVRTIYFHSNLAYFRYRDLALLNPLHFFFFYLFIYFYFNPQTQGAKYKTRINTMLLDFVSHLPAIAVGTLLFFLFLYPFWQELVYRLQVWLKQRNGERIGYPRMQWSIPLGIPRLIKLLEYSFKQRLFSDWFLPEFRGKGVRTFRNQSLGSFQFLTVDPENLKAMLSTNFEDYSIGSRYESFFPLLGRGLFTLDGPEWKHSRAIMKPQFSRQQISHTSTIEAHLQQLMRIIDENGEHGQKGVEIQDLMMKFTLDTATEFLFGFSAESLTNGNPEIEYAREFSGALSHAQQMLAERVRADKFYMLVDSPKFRRNAKLCKDYAMKFVMLALKQKKQEKEKYVFLEELAKETQDPILLRDQALNVLMAGRDTTSALVSWVLYFLALKPKVFERLRKEVVMRFGEDLETGEDQAITFESLKRCEYLRHVINETMRLVPLVPANMREAIRDTVLPRGGYDPTSPDPQNEDLPLFVPKGTAVVYFTYVLHRDKERWGPDVDEFRPERWEDARQSEVTRHPWAFIPFSGGPRVCLGQQFALHEGSYVLVRLLQKYRQIIPAYDGAITDDPDTGANLTLTATAGVNLKFVQ